MDVEFECIICGESAVATVNEARTEPTDGRLETLRDCPTCNIETIWIES